LYHITSFTLIFKALLAEGVVFEYFREWNTWLMKDRCHYYPVFEA